MYSDNIELLKEVVSKKIGEKVVFLGNIANIIDNLGKGYSRNTIRKHLQSKRIDLSKIWVNPEEFGMSDSLSLYRESDVWNYLQSIDEKRGLKLAERGISSYKDILDRGHDRTSSRRLPHTGRRVGRNVGEPDPSFEDTIRLIEDRE
jgi:hypothetical protein